jgi:hypothetical protein
LQDGSAELDLVPASRATRRKIATWSALLAGFGDFAQVNGSASNFGFGYRTSGASGSLEKHDGA